MKTLTDISAKLENEPQTNNDVFHQLHALYNAHGGLKMGMNNYVKQNVFSTVIPLDMMFQTEIDNFNPETAFTTFDLGRRTEEGIP